MTPEDAQLEASLAWWLIPLALGPDPSFAPTNTSDVVIQVTPSPRASLL